MAITEQCVIWPLNTLEPFHPCHWLHLCNSLFCCLIKKKKEYQDCSWGLNAAFITQKLASEACRNIATSDRDQKYQEKSRLLLLLLSLNDNKKKDD